MRWWNSHFLGGEEQLWQNLALTSSLPGSDDVLLQVLLGVRRQGQVRIKLHLLSCVDQLFTQHALRGDIGVPEGFVVVPGDNMRERRLSMNNHGFS